MIKDGECYEVIKNLFLGNVKTSMSKSTLTKFEITHILCVGFELREFYKEVKLFYNKNFVYLKLNVSDTIDENILKDFNIIYE